MAQAAAHARSPIARVPVRRARLPSKIAECVRSRRLKARARGVQTQGSFPCQRCASVLPSQGFARDDGDSHGAFEVVPRGSDPVDTRAATAISLGHKRNDVGDAPLQDLAPTGNRFPAQRQRTLRSFPELPPLSQPPSPAARTRHTLPHDNDIVEISDSD